MARLCRINGWLKLGIIHKKCTVYIQVKRSLCRGLMNAFHTEHAALRYAAGLVTGFDNVFSKSPVQLTVTESPLQGHRSRKFTVGPLHYKNTHQGECVLHTNRFYMVMSLQQPIQCKYNTFNERRSYSHGQLPWHLAKTEERTCQCWRAALHSEWSCSIWERKWKHSPWTAQTTRRRNPVISGPGLTWSVLIVL